MDLGTETLRRVAGMLAAALSVLAIAPAVADSPGVTGERVLFGQSAALGGPASDLGIQMRRGILAAFDEANRAGGVGGRMLQLMSYDDRYEPELAIANTRRLIEDDRVFALIGEVGTPTSAAAVPIAHEAGVPFIGPFTGAEFLRDPSLTNVVNIRASYFEETEAMVDRLVRDLDISRIAVLYQDDTYGRTGLAGVQQALERRGMTLAASGAYMRNTTAIKTALLGMRRHLPDAIVIIGAYQPSAAFIRWARKLNVNAVIFNISFVGSNALATAIGRAGDGTYITQVVPFPDGDSLPLTAEYRAALAALDPTAEPSFGSLEGYIAGRLTAAALAAAGDDLTRESFLAALERTGTFDIGGFVLRYGPGDNRGSNSVYLTVIEDGAVVPVERLSR